MDASIPSFFKIFLPNLAANRLLIPPKFVQHLRHESKGMVHLKGPTGKIWNVELVEDGKEMAFEKGWKEFVADHSIVLGDFLLFGYEGSSCFTVLVYEKTACQKQFVSSPQGDDVSVAIENENTRKRRIDDDHGGDRTKLNQIKASSNDKQESEEIDRGNFRAKTASKTAMLPSKTPALPLRFSARERKKSVTCLCCNSCTDELVAETTSKHPRVSSNDQPKIPAIPDKLINEIKEESEHPEPPTKGTKSRSGARHKLQQSQSLTYNINDMHIPKCGYVESHRRPVTKDEIAHPVRMAKSFKSKYPFVTIVMQKAYVYRGFMLHIPNAFARKHLVKVPMEMILWDPNGIRWEVLCKCHSKRTSFTAGWYRFSLVNNLERNDVCIFELIKSNEMRVHIFRVVEEITPLIKWKK
ncbi:B3 DNA binding domain-containing protein [Dioscorea alata]|uniref:B3 DNA binding domain-containing protein n=1 Tax=Dioscorea alata TaxID=55571 RepID=A0ACB7UEB5_DIOAL|nr:B3 DNA binding domain-containing protein [Dioscorea alata]